MSEILSTLYPWIKSFHLISLIAWMAGLFYLPRLYVYHVESVGMTGEQAELFQTMERKLLKIIMNPAMIATWLFGLLLIGIPGIVDFSSAWIWIKLLCVLLMSGFHGWLGKQRKLFVSGDVTLTGRHFRIMNEVPTVLLAIIVIMVVVKPF